MFIKHIQEFASNGREITRSWVQFQRILLEWRHQLLYTLTILERYSKAFAVFLSYKIDLFFFPHRVIQFAVFHSCTVEAALIAQKGCCLCVSCIWLVVVPVLLLLPSGDKTSKKSCFSMTTIKIQFYLHLFLFQKIGNVILKIICLPEPRSSCHEVEVA